MGDLADGVIGMTSLGVTSQPTVTILDSELRHTLSHSAGRKSAVLHGNQFLWPELTLHSPCPEASLAAAYLRAEGESL
jgi:hypothetical protein